MCFAVSKWIAEGQDCCVQSEKAAQVELGVTQSYPDGVLH